MSKATLLVIHGADEGARFELEPGISIGIGRHVSNKVNLIDSEISREHARIESQGSVFELVDLNSSNGTYVNGTAVKTHRLRGGDRVHVGRTVMVFSEQVGPTSGGVVGMIDLLPIDAADQSRIVEQVAPSQETMLGRSAVDPSIESRKTLSNLQTLYRISEEVVRPSLPIEQLMQRILDMTIDALGADRGCVLSSDEQSGDVVPQVVSCRAGNPATDRMPVSMSIVEYVLEHGQGVRTTDARSDTRFEQGQSILRAGIREAMCVPLQGHAELLGVVYVDTTVSSDTAVLQGGETVQFNEDQLRLLLAIGRQAALALEANRYQQAFVKAERLAAVGQTIATLSHHIKNILQGVRGGSYLIDMGLRDENQEMVRNGWGIVERNQGKIYHLVMDMLTFSTERQPTLEAEDLNRVLGDVCELMQARSVECGVDFQYELANDIPESLFDADGLQRAILNVTTNAIDAVEGEPDARVALQSFYDQQTDTLLVSVSDNGPGIPADQVDKIFNMFESSKGARGTGLGLAVSKKILHEHGGEIEVESQLGAGCRFTLRWPRLDSDPRQDAPTLSG